MAMPEGTKRWATLATWDNEAVYAYFRDHQKLSHKHAMNTLQKLRDIHNADGSRKSGPRQYTPLNWTPSNYTAKSEPAATEPTTASELEKQLLASLEPASTPTSDPEPEPRRPDPYFPATSSPEPTSPVTQEPAIVSDIVIPDPTTATVDAAGDALARMVAPSLVGLLRAELKAAVDKLAPVRELVVIREKREFKISGTAHSTFPKIAQLVNQGLNVMMVGPAGCGKTILADSVAQSLSRKLTCISCSAGMSEAGLLGRLLPLGEGGAFRYVPSPFITAYENGGVILLDEVDAADANLLLVINAALANGGITVEARAANGLDTYVKRHSDTVVLAAANTWGHGADTSYVGRGALDASTLDRFYRVGVDYDHSIETAMADADTVRAVHRIREKVRSHKLRRTVSTRMIARVACARAAGLSLSEALADETASWSADEKAKVL